MDEPAGPYWAAELDKMRRYWEAFHADEDPGELEYRVYEFRCVAESRPCLWDSHMELDQGYLEAIAHQRKTGHKVEGRPMVRPPVDFRGLED